MLLETAVKRFNSNIKITETRCWEWQKSRTPQGYGKFKFDGEQLAHRISWLMHHGEFNRYLCVLHVCDNPPCVNPAHLFLGTWEDNNRDRADKKRNNHVNENKTHCKRGHEFNKTNTGIRKNGCRYCKRCEHERYLKRIGRL